MVVNPRVRESVAAAFTPDDSPLTWEDVEADPRMRRLQTPDLAVGDRAFDFELPVYDFATGVRTETGRSVRLSEFAGRRPVALIFGSYT